MKKLWKRATGAIKDKRSILIAKLSPHSDGPTSYVQSIIIKATNHDQCRIDYKNVQRVLRFSGSSSPSHLKHLLFSLSWRMQKTQSWVVALKGLMLMHDIFCCNFPMLQTIGRLPFDLSNFSDAHLKPPKVWGYNAFVHSYFEYLDQRSAFLSSEHIKKIQQSKEIEDSLMQELEKLQKMQSLMDMILQIRPQNEHMYEMGLIVEAMDCVVVELFDLYGKFCKGMDRIVLRINDMGGKEEAKIGIHVLQNAEIQVDKMSCYFELCKEIGVVNVSQCSNMQRISDENVQTLQRIIVGNDIGDDYEYEDDKIEKDLKDDVDEKEKAIVVRDCNSSNLDEHKISKTVITEKWEVFEDDLSLLGFRDNPSNAGNVIAPTANPFQDHSSTLQYVQFIQF